MTPPIRPPQGRRQAPEPDVLDVLCPMHLIVDDTGIITHAGPTLCKMMAPSDLRGSAFLDVFRLKRPRGVTAMADLLSDGGMKLHLALRHPPRTALKGVVVPMDPVAGTLVVNLSFGISVVDGVRDFALTNADFAATDLAIEMLYLIEAKTAAMEASRKLNLRLQGAKTVAEEAATTDTLTGLKNRRALDQVLDVLVEGRAPFAVMRIDLDYFKAVNDTYGHAAGDHVLRKVAQVMLEETRDSDVVVREGGDEFTILLPQVKAEDILRQIARRIIDRIEEPILFEGQTCKVSASIGTVWIEKGEKPSVAGVLDDADIALYASKRAGRAQQTIYTKDLRTRSGIASQSGGRGARV
ncbi:diguanylate cyclase domain-containing protein [Sulfitobacter sp. JB4-11]|uniref:diguanylate cyclase domain-containing protein n=1 Tax=Sulfitobacter rhodophyticola TaxID=3238304 RepID=UPI003516CE4F